MKVALIQMDPAWEDRAENMRRAGAFLEEAARAGAHVAVLPEMFATGFTMNLGVAEPGENAETGTALSAIAGRLGLCVIAGLSVKTREGRGRNLALVYDGAGRQVASYAKANLFPLSGEDRVFEAGGRPGVFDLGGVPSGVFICYDLRFPEMFRPLAPRMACAFVIANWPSSRAEHWESLLRARAIENQLYVVGVNRTGVDGNGIAYPGASRVFGPMGETVLEAGSREGVLLAELEIDEVARVRREYPFLPPTL